MLHVSRKRIKNTIAKLIMSLYKSMVWPHLEHCVQFWSPHYKQGICTPGKSAKEGKQNAQTDGASTL